MPIPSATGQTSQERGGTRNPAAAEAAAEQRASVERPVRSRDLLLRSAELQPDLEPGARQALDSYLTVASLAPRDASGGELVGLDLFV